MDGSDTCRRQPLDQEKEAVLQVCYVARRAVRTYGDIVRFFYGYYKLIFFKLGLIASLSQFPFVALPGHSVFARHLQIHA
jgi:hypothetical protein